MIIEAEQIILNIVGKKHFIFLRNLSVLIELWKIQQKYTRIVKKLGKYFVSVSNKREILDKTFYDNLVLELAKSYYFLFDFSRVK